MGKDKKKKTLKIKCDVICPMCGENHYPYTRKNGKQKCINGLLNFTICLFALFHHRCYHSYDCLTCGYKWEVRAY